ncbi:MAG: response regulator receiver protein [Chloroflexi bacterium]|jgi:DNA-binding response OmpR family regulator|nr:response regulator receiver protein [Chloroflexota bacterium]
MTSGRSAPPPAPAVEVLPEGTLRGGPRGPIGERTAFVIDSSATVQLIAHTLLEIAGFSVESFGAPHAALQRAVELRPDVVVLEPRSPGIDAFATMRALSRLHGAEAAPVVWCTTVEPTADAVEEGARLGLRGVLVKPFRLEALTALVLRVCRRADRERRLAMLGIPPDELTTRILSGDATRLWARAEIELADAARARRSLSLVAVGADTSEATAAVRRAVRAVDTMGSAPAHVLLVLLPDVDESGAAVVAGRVAASVAALEPAPVVGRVTRRDGEDETELLARAVLEVIVRRVG